MCQTLLEWKAPQIWALCLISNISTLLLELKISPVITLEALSWLMALIHQSEEGQWDVSVSQSDESIWRESEVSCGWVRLFDGRFPGWLMVFWMTDEVDDLVECIGIPELIDWTSPQFTSWISKWTSLSVFHFYPPCFPLSALVSFIFFLKSHFLSLSVFMFFLVLHASVCFWFETIWLSHFVLAYYCIPPVLPLRRIQLPAS